MAEWQPATTGQLTHVDHIYLTNGFGDSWALFAGTNASGDAAVLENGLISYGSGFDPGWFENGSYIYTNGYAAGLYKPFKLVDDPSSVNMRIVWAGNPDTAAAGTALIQDVHHTQGVITQFIVTCTSPAGAELAHYHAFTNGNFMLTWQTDETPTNTAVLGRYTWNGTWVNGANVPCVFFSADEEIAVPSAYIPAHGNQPQKLLWAWKWGAAPYWESAIIQRLDANYAPTGNALVYGPIGNWDSRPLRWDYLYAPGSGSEAYFRLEWVVGY